MNSSPIRTTIILLAPLLGFSFPLAHVIYKQPPRQVEISHNAEAMPMIKADFEIQSAHPYHFVRVTIDESSWNFNEVDEIQEVHFRDAETVTAKIEVAWPGDTPLTALKVTLIPTEPSADSDSPKEQRSNTLWANGTHQQDVKFEW